MTWPSLHDWSVDIGIYRLCSRCAKPDLNANRRMPCWPLQPDAIEPALRRKVAMAGRFRGTPSTTGRPTMGAPRRARLPIP